MGKRAFTGTAPLTTNGYEQEGQSHNEARIGV